MHLVVGAPLNKLILIVLVHGNLFSDDIYLVDLHKETGVFFFLCLDCVVSFKICLNKLLPQILEPFEQ